MVFKEAFEALKQGKKIKLPHWTGYWKVEDNGVKMFCKDGRVLDLRESEDIFYTLGNIVADDWEVVGEDYDPELNIHTFGFGEAIRLMKAGGKVARKGWNGKDMFIFIAEVCEFDTDADLSCVSHLEGDLALPSIVMKTADDHFCIGWVATQMDMLADDWVQVE